MPVRSPGSNRGALPGDRLLTAATSLFDREGIRAVGIERLIAEADVARASLYQAFGSKDSLVVAYLEHADRADRERYTRALRGASDDPVDRVAVFFRLALAGARRRRFRGCLYVNAATEFPDARHPVHGVVRAHRRWQLDEFTDTARHAGAAEPERLGRRLQLLYDGALVGSKAARTVEPIEEAATMAGELVAGTRVRG